MASFAAFLVIAIGLAGVVALTALAWGMAAVALGHHRAGRKQQVGVCIFMIMVMKLVAFGIAWLTLLAAR